MKGDEELELAELAAAMGAYAELVDRVVAQITPEDTDRALANIFARAGYAWPGYGAQPETD